MAITIATFNVNSVKSRIPVLTEWFDREGAPDVLCLQETKCRDEDFPAYFFEDYYDHCVFRGMKSYNGVAVLSKREPDEVWFGLGDGEAAEREESENARVALARFGELFVLNTYIPQGKEIDNPDYPYKLRFIERVRGLLERRCSPEGLVVWVGDLNVAPTDIDVTNPKNKKDHVCFHEDVKKALAYAMEWGLVDIFREHLPEAGEYTFWDYRVKEALARNIGWRIDHVLGTKRAAALCRSVRVERELRALDKPSDHTAVTAEFDIEF
ncbi:exodeoxyribonuclease III [Cloacibacillus sp. An23]|uniref:exodeoxyribonuclease III n=1 Tax=Cloacibacillus sp. An23 TaxID=1965591 RepID=UPI000B36DFF2|nr:exodeoxyribonuclease III [Cloacibacillus sp. An23]OUO94623.1 exodeoxyribonuclease III [Cloacibacillus sp. An23]